MPKRIRGWSPPGERVDDSTPLPSANAFALLWHDVKLPADASQAIRRRAWLLSTSADLSWGERFADLYALAGELGVTDQVDRQLADLAQEQRRPDGSFVSDVRRMAAV